jgi:hypothetical protein
LLEKDNARIITSMNTLILIFICLPIPLVLIAWTISCFKPDSLLLKQERGEKLTKEETEHIRMKRVIGGSF